MKVNPSATSSTKQTSDTANKQRFTPQKRFSISELPKVNPDKKKPSIFDLERRKKPTKKGSEKKKKPLKKQQKNLSETFLQQALLAKSTPLKKPTITLNSIERLSASKALEELFAKLSPSVKTMESNGITSLMIDFKANQNPLLKNLEVELLHFDTANKSFNIFFHVQTESVANFIAENIPDLKERLKKHFPQIEFSLFNPSYKPLKSKSTTHTPLSPQAKVLTPDKNSFIKS